jgi:hypothetical protein
MVELLDGWPKSERIKAAVALIISGIAALFIAWDFKDQMPVADWFYHLRGTWLYPISAADLCFHEAGHWIYGILGIRFITVAGGTLMQFTFPIVCLVNFLKFQKSLAGVLFSISWIGFNFMETCWYMADAKVQVLILTTGMTGKEGGGHDWANMLGWLDLTDDCVGMATVVYWVGTTLFLFPIPWLIIFLWNRYVKTAD